MLFYVSHGGELSEEAAPELRLQEVKSASQQTQKEERTAGAKPHTKNGLGTSSHSLGVWGIQSEPRAGDGVRDADLNLHPGSSALWQGIRHGTDD